MKRIFLGLHCIFSIGFKVAYAEEQDDGDMKDMFVHPFPAHMALPDRPGEVSLRITPFQQRTGAATRSDYAFHVEAGLPELHVCRQRSRQTGYSLR